MKKLYTLLLAAAATSAVSAEPVYVLNTIESNDHVETLYYAWNEDGLIRKISDMSEEDTETSNTVRRIIYNDKKQIIRDEVYQNVFGLDTREWQKYMLVNYAEYTYNILGQLETRLNYNWDQLSVEGKLNLGACIEYQYNADGKLSKVATYWDKDRTKLWGEDTYTYTDGVLTQIDLAVVPYGGTLPEVDMRQKYSYSEDGDLLKIEDYKIDSLDGEEVFDKSVVYEYDAQGEINAVTRFKGRLESSKFVMHYNDIPAADVVWPVTMEQENFDWSYLFAHITNAIDSQEVWLYDNLSDTLYHTFNWLFDYEDYEAATTGVQGVQAVPAMNLTVASCNGDRLMLGGVDRMDMVTIYDAQGRQVLTSGYEMGSINVAALPAGAYVVRAAGQAVKFVK